MKLGGSIFEKIWIFVQEAIRYSVTKNVVHAAFSYTNWDTMLKFYIQPPLPLVPSTRITKKI